jgi:hypothetical protein
MDISRKNVVVLAVCQGLLLINNTVLITVNALVGYALAPEKALATLPVTGSLRSKVAPLLAFTSVPSIRSATFMSPSLLFSVLRRRSAPQAFFPALH